MGAAGVAAVRMRRAGWNGARRLPQTPRDDDGWEAGCLGIHESLTLWLDIPLGSRRKAEKVIPSLLDIQLPFPVEDCLFRIVVFRRTAPKALSALICAARRDAIRACLERYRAQGLDPAFLDHEGLALWTQSLLERPPEAHQARALLLLEPDRTALVTGCGTRFGAAYSLGLPADDEGAVNRLRLLAHTGLRADAATHWLFSGSRAGDPDLVGRLHRALSGTRPGPAHVHDDPADFLIRALGTRAVTRGPLRCNLRQDDFTHPALRRAAAHRAAAAAAAMLAAGLLLIAFSAGSLWLGSRRAARLQARIESLARELAPGAAIPYGRELAEAQKAWTQRRAETAPFLDALGPSLAGRLGAVIRAGEAVGVTFETLDLKRGRLLLSGSAPDWDLCGRLQQLLQNLGYAAKLDREAAIGENAVRFTISGEEDGL